MDRDEVNNNLMYSSAIHVTSIQDDEIDINELDFALKAVNYDLISDAELEYVNQVIILLDTTDWWLVELIDLRTIQPIQAQLSFVLSNCCFIRESGCSRVMSYSVTVIPLAILLCTGTWSRNLSIKWTLRH